ncbi:MAG: hypothetical protein U1F52_16640 [Burkholderiales bacterium]
MYRTSPERRPHGRGFALPSAIFLLVILAMLGGFIVSVSGQQSSAQALDVAGMRGYEAARAGIEWGMLQVLDPHNTDAGLSAATRVPPACFATTTLALGSRFDNASVSVTCTRTSTTEADRQIAVYALVATATGGSTAYPMNRQVTATAARCVDPGGVAPRYACP